MYEAFEQFRRHGMPLFSSAEDVNILRELVEEFYFLQMNGCTYVPYN